MPPLYGLHRFWQVALVLTAHRKLTTILFIASMSLSALAGGSGWNVLVVVNQNSTNSVQLGNYYCEKRGVPPQNLLRINWAGGNVNWTRVEFENNLRTPIVSALTSRQLTNQIEYVVLCMDIPYRVTEATGLPATSGQNSTSAAMFYGFKPDGVQPFGSCNLPVEAMSAYAGSEGIFRQTPPISALSNSWLTMLLTSSNLAQAKLVVDRAVASDYLIPTQRVFLAKGQDRLRNIRHYLFDNTILNTRISGAANLVRTNVNNPVALSGVRGYQSGEQVFSQVVSNYLPGALVDNLTSFSGYILENSGHTDALDCLNAGAIASYGTIIEPCAYYQKFPSPQLFFYQARGYSVAECYYLSVTNPYQGLLIGEPLAAPFAVPLAGNWSGLPSGAVLAGTTNLSVIWQSGTNRIPVGQVDLFLDGKLLHTITNLPPRWLNNLHITLNGAATTYAVPFNPTIKSVADGLAAHLNGFSYSNTTKVAAFAHGDRIELQSLDINRVGTDTTLVVSNSIGAAAALTTHISAARSNFVDRVAQGIRSFIVTNSFGSNVPAGSWLQATVIKTNGVTVTVAVTNASSANQLRNFAREFFDHINTNALTATADGVQVDNVNMHEDPPYDQFIYGFNDHSGEFDLLARSPGWLESQVRVRFAASAGLAFTPGTTNRLDENVTDLRPRNHLFITAGLTNLNLSFPFNTTTNADGHHELAVVAYDGSHVRTQQRLTRNILIQNNGWSATLTALLGGTNTALEAMLQFSVVTDTNNITAIELFSTGGSLGISNNVNSTSFTIPSAFMGLGLHPFYAVVTRSGGKQYRTATQWIRIVGSESPFVVSVLDDLPTLSWPATAGRSYQILSTTNLGTAFAVRDGVTPTNSVGLWAETNNASGARFYRVKTP